ncbi:MAG: DUF2855 family protein [Rubrivivax sp.]|jgi:hypothetical protein
MIEDAGIRCLVARQGLQQLRFAPDSDAPAARPLADGEVRLATAHFALTANNITYAAFGEAMQYWRFFPAEDADWGCIPVWGFATVCESRVDSVPRGTRVYGYLPMGSHVVLQPRRVNEQGFMDGSAHRQDLAAAYNHYRFCASDPGYSVDGEARQALLQPLFATAFLIDDFLQEQAWFGAEQLVLSSASSKTAWSTAFCIAQRPAGERPRLLGLTSPGNQAFVQGTALFDDVLPYDALESLDRQRPTVYVDFAGHSGLRRRVHQHFGDALGHSCAVGGTHWGDLGGGGGLPGPRPVLFFAPGQMKKRSAPPPEGWGPGGLQQRMAQSWSGLMSALDSSAKRGQPWLDVHTAQGATAVEAAYRQLLGGQTPPQQGWMLAMR